MFSFRANESRRGIETSKHFASNQVFSTRSLVKMKLRIGALLLVPLLVSAVPPPWKDTTFDSSINRRHDWWYVK